jgi:hypothetical protein
VEKIFRERLWKTLHDPAPYTVSREHARTEEDQPRLGKNSAGAIRHRLASRLLPVGGFAKTALRKRITQEFVKGSGAKTDTKLTPTVCAGFGLDIIQHNGPPQTAQTNVPLLL